MIVRIISKSIEIQFLKEELVIALQLGYIIIIRQPVSGVDPDRFLHSS